MPFGTEDAELLKSILDAAIAGRSSGDLAEAAQPLVRRGLLYWDPAGRLRLSDVGKALLRMTLRK